MIMENTSLQYPRLNFQNHYEEVIENAYQQVQNCPICWLAYEQLESSYQNQMLSDNIAFSMENGFISFKDIPTGTVIGYIDFDPNLLSVANV